MKYRNAGVTVLTLDNGKPVKPGGTFDAKHVDQTVLRRWVRAGSARLVVKAKKETT